MSTHYICPGCGESDPSNFKSIYTRRLSETVSYSIKGVDSEDTGNAIVNDNTPDNDSDCEPHYHEDQSEDDEEFNHYKCDSCGREFKMFDEEEEDVEEEEEEEEEEDTHHSTLPDENVTDDLSNFNTEERAARKELTGLLEDEELVIPSDLVAKAKQALDRKSSVETLRKFLAQIREL
jgi:DNA-directed RNA polymerase subunit M/transcription elongation factor TFIIS